MKTIQPKRAIVSVSDKTGLVEFCRFLDKNGVEILSTGGTSKALREASIHVNDISEYTKSPEVMEGRVKTLHPRVHGGILAKRVSRHLSDLDKIGGKPIDLVVVNLYPFEETAASGAGIDEIIENIDIGGPSMVRSAAKNHEWVCVLTDPGDYDGFIKEWESNGGITVEFRKRMALKAFYKTASYDKAISTTLSKLYENEDKTEYPDILPLTLKKKSTLRYGENPHQKASLYACDGGGLIDARVLSGKEMSFNNYLDAEGAVNLCSEFKEPAVVIVKHTNPCGAASAEDLLRAYKMAFETDALSAFGGIVAINRPLTLNLTEAMKDVFYEIIIAPSFEKDAFEMLSKKKNLRLIEMPIAPSEGLDYRRINGGFLVQERDNVLFSGELKVVTKRQPGDEELKAMKFGWIICKHAKSNAVVFSNSCETLSIGMGQVSRVDAVKLAIMKSNKPLKGSAAASDAFFPFPDGVEEIARGGATAIIQPGGSIRDKDVIATADKLGLTMVFTDIRHFRH